MKRLTLLVMPLMTLSFLTSCGRGKTYTITWVNYNDEVLEVDKGVKKGEMPHYDGEVPVKPEDNVGIYEFKGWDGDITKGITANTTFIAQFDISIHKYKVSVDVDAADYLFFTKDDKSLVTAGVTTYENEEFTFQMSLNKNASNNDYKLPNALNIYVGDTSVPLEPGNYSIKPTIEGHANVTINANRVNGDILISGEAIEINKYRVDIKSFCTTDDFEGGLQMCSDELDIKFSQQGSYETPNEENILINIDNKEEWFTPKDDSSHQYCSYNETTSTLTINANVVTSNIAIRAFTPDADLLESLDWDTINEFSMSKLALKLFSIGSTKTVKVNDLDHQVRIIGFNHDDLIKEKGKAGITFEFANVVTNSNGTVTTHWNDKNGRQSTNYNFPESTLNDLLNKNDDCIFNQLPKGLKRAIKEVNKKVGLGVSYITYMPYKTKLFPLAHDEIANHRSNVPDGEGTKYQYYINSQDKDRTKKNTNGAEEQYLLRSPVIGNGNNKAWCVGKRGGLFEGYEVYQYSFAVAPAFCI